VTVPPELLGPLGLTFALILAVGFLVRDHALDGWRAQTEATDRLASAIETRNREDEARKRRTDR
jgi:hypothetical protein